MKTSFLITKFIGTLCSIFLVFFIVFFIISASRNKLTPKRARVQGIMIGSSAETGLDFSKTVEDFFRWIKKIPSFSFGRSAFFGEKVSVIVSERLKNTLLLNFLSLFILFLSGIALGVLSAVFKNGFISFVETIFFIIYAIPDFILAIFLILVFSLKFNLFPASGIISLNHSQLSFAGKVWDVLKHMFLPALSLSLSSVIFLARFTKNSVIGVLENYHITALAVRGADNFKNKAKHVLKNAVFPFISLLTFIIPGLIGGSIIIETIFGYPGIGKVFYTAVVQRDFPLLLAVSFINVIAVFFSIFLTDILYEIFKTGDENEKSF